MSSVFAIVLVLGGLIFFHELGHFAFARLFGVGVKTFSLGFGPKIFGFRRGKTEYRLSAIPLGGYVSMVGFGTDEELEEGFTKEETFTHKPIWQRMCIVASGPIANLLLAFLIYWCLLWSQGQMHMAPEIGDIRAESPAAASGMQAGDLITRIGETPITDWTDIAETISASGGRELLFTVQRNNEELTFTATPTRNVRKNLFGEDEETFLVGIVASGKTFTVPLNSNSAAVAAVKQTWQVISLTGQGFKKLFERKVPLDSVGGPIMIAQMVSEQAKAGFAPVLGLAALISINLGLLNLLPIPVLDGGHLVFLAIEGITRRPVPAQIQELTTRIGVTLLLMLMALATYNDFMR